ncbi:MAG: MaoC/PaaZ C-terminal domain-containing protein [Myxococcota bacterium]
MICAWQEIEVGGEIPRLVKPPIDTTQLVRYAGASGDFNRIHFDQDFAREGGFPTVIAVGMLSAGFLGQMLVAWAGPAAVTKIAVRFKAVTFPGDVVTCRGVVTAKREDAGQRLVDLKIWCEKQDGAVTVEGTATVVVA